MNNISINDMIDKTFTIDLTTLYEAIGNSHTTYGYHIDYDNFEDCYYLMDGDYSVAAIHGEECKIVDVRETSLGKFAAIYNLDNLMPRHALIPEMFALSEEEVAACCNTTH